MSVEHDVPNGHMSEMQQLAVLQSRPRSFIDMKAFASEVSQGTALSASPRRDSFQSNRRFLDLLPGPVTAGVVALARDSGTVSFQPADEFVIVSEGTITFTQGARVLTLRPGDSAVLRHGAAFSWEANGPVSIIFMRHQGDESTDGNDGTIVPIDGSPQLEPSGAPLAELLLTPTPQCRNQTDYRSPDGKFTCGRWDSTPYRRVAMLYRHHELMYLLEGSVTFVDETGRSSTFSRGDIFLVEQGAKCSWESAEHVAKVYAIFRPA